MKRKLVLRSHAVFDLTTDELASVVAGSHLCAPEITHGTTCDVECEVPTNPFNTASRSTGA